MNNYFTFIDHVIINTVAYSTTIISFEIPLRYYHVACTKLIIIMAVSISDI